MSHTQTQAAGLPAAHVDASKRIQRLSCSSPVGLKTPFTPSQRKIKTYKAHIRGGKASRWKGTWSWEHRLQVEVPESVNTNLLLSVELGNLRQRWLSILADLTFLFPDSKQQQRPSSLTAGLLTLWQKKSLTVVIFLCFADWARADQTLCCSACCFLLVLTRRSSPQTHRQGCSRYWQPVAIAILQV